MRLRARFSLSACLLALAGCSYFGYEEGAVVPAAVLRLDAGTDTTLVRVTNQFHDTGCASPFLEQTLGPGESLIIPAQYRRIPKVIASDILAGLTVCLQQGERRIRGIRISTTVYGRDTIYIHCKIPWTDSLPPVFAQKDPFWQTNPGGACEAWEQGASKNDSGGFKPPYSPRTGPLGS